MRSTNPRVIAIGEVLWDLLPGGSVMGGAPANFAFHAHALGADANLVTCVGNDELGRKIIKNLEFSGFPTELIEVHPLAPTGTVSVELGAAGQPHYTIHENVAWDFIMPSTAALKAVADANVVCFGTLAQRSEVSRATIRALVEATPKDALRICDINMRKPFVSREIIADSLGLANVLKLNDAELPVLSEMFELQGNDHRQQMRELLQRFGLQIVALTRGENGSIILSGENISEHPGIPVKVRDTIGAGDAFTAALAFGFVHGWPLDTINEYANAVAAFVCSQPGATPSLPSQLCKVFLNLA